MAEETVKFFTAQFHEDTIPTSFEIIDHVPNMLNEAENQDLIRQPTREEVKQAVYGSNGQSAGGPDGFNGSFFHACWETIGDDVVEMVKAFFN